MFKNSKSFIGKLLVICVTLLFTGCSYRSSLKAPVSADELPQTWHQAAQGGEVNDGWLRAYTDSTADELIAKALNNNFLLLASQQVMKQAKSRAAVADADRWPQLALSLDGSRSQTQVNQQNVIGNSFSLGASVSWEADLWGKLSARDQAAIANVLAAKADYQAFRLSVAANVLKAWYNIKESRQLLTLFEQRLANLQENQEVIERGFRQGINGALDVYLARSDVNREKARVKEQQQKLSDRIRELQVLVGQFPDGKLSGDQVLPPLPDAVPVGVPAQLLQRRYDIQAAMFRLQNADANLAAAHRNRFPSLSLTAGGGKSSQDFNDLLNGSNQWSLTASLLQVVFDQGRLKALEQEARYQLLEQEQRYKDVVFNAFKEVESFLSNEQALFEQLQSYLLAQENALAAEQQAFEQYRKGLVSYTAVLESQRRAFDSQSSVIQLRNQLLQNRINLHVALGGSFE